MITRSMYLRTPSHAITVWRLQRSLLERNAAASASASAFASISSTCYVSTSAASSQLVPQITQSSPRGSLVHATAIAGLSLAVGFGAGLSYHNNYHNSNRSVDRVLPSGLPRTCCEEENHHQHQHHHHPNNSTTNTDTTTAPAPLALRPEHVKLGEALRRIVGQDNVLDGFDKDGNASVSSKIGIYTRGARLGHGSALYIVTPQSLADVVDCVEAIIDAQCVVLTQGKNTGLTGGSVPHSADPTRPTVIVSMKQLTRIFPIDNGKRVVCLAGVGLAQLQQFLAKHFPDRESHSTLGSTFLNPTTAAGVAFGSGGTQLRKGPAYTDRALYLKVSTNKWQENVVEVVNTLGVEGMHDNVNVPAHRARRMDRTPSIVDAWSRLINDQGLRDMKYSSKASPHGHAPAHDVTYRERVCSCTNELSRFNADTRGLDPNRSEGKVVILATVHDTFEKPKRTKHFWISVDCLETALDLRREVCLDNPEDLPVSVEYMNQDSYDVIDRSGRLMAWSIRLLGPLSPLIRNLFQIKLSIEALPYEGADLIVDKILHWVNPIIPPIAPRSVRDCVNQGMKHHIMLKVGDFGDGEMDRVLDRLQKFIAKRGGDKIVSIDCTDHDNTLNAVRFVAASAFRTWCVGEGVQGISVDYALPLNDGQAPDVTGSHSNHRTDSGASQTHSAGEVPAIPIKRMRYSHFGCNVVHEDLAYALGVDVHKAKHDLKANVEQQCKGRLPAEHGHGTEYVAPKETKERWMKMDPLNVLNPGVGGLSSKYKYEP